ncbi:MAG: hypothetical protein KC589_11460, partial [Nanoarchaeota archaeon]|nr:hypothetical protein [Nanoarchaeota archaeon]
MEDIKNNFTSSFHVLKNNFRLFFPFFFSQASLYLFLVLFIIISGIGAIFYDIYSINSEYSIYSSKVILENSEIINKETYFKNNFDITKYSYLFSYQIFFSFFSL